MEQELNEQGAQLEDGTVVDNGGVDSSQVSEQTTKDSGMDKMDYFETRLSQPKVSTENLMSIYGADGFDAFKSKEEYWKSPELQKSYEAKYGLDASYRFNEDYNKIKYEYSKFQEGHFQKSVSGYELVRDDLSALRSDATMRFTNMNGTIMEGLDWSAPTKDYRENFTHINVRKLDDEGNESFESIEYSPEALKKLEEDSSFGGLAYSDAFYNLDPNEGVNGLYFNTITDGKVLDEATGTMVDVRNDQIVSRWDLETGNILDGVLKNNKLEADSVLDLAKIMVKAPINMAVNMMDTAVQLSRGAVAGVYGVHNLISDEELDVNADETYKWLTTKGVKLKSGNTSMTREAIQDGFFGSLEAALTTTADIALQVALAGALGRAGSAVPNIINKGLTGKALAQAQKRAAEISVRGTLTALAVKDSYNEALENGYSNSEASLITGAMGIAMWKATKYASYIFGEHEVKLVRDQIRSSIRTELKESTHKALKNVAEKVVKNPSEVRAKKIYDSVHKAVANVFGKVTKQIDAKKWLYAARQEGLEEMTEELFQDGVKQVASAYGYLINNAHEAGKGRYMSIFDEGYFKDAAERYATSGIAGAMGGPMGMIGSGRANVSNLTNTSSVTEILLAGRKEELVEILKEMKSNGELGPNNLSTEYNYDVDAFDPIIQGEEMESLSDMVFNTYLHDINVIDTYMNEGDFGGAAMVMRQDSNLRDFVDQNSIRKDFTSLMGSLVEFHKKTGLTMGVYAEMNELTEADFETNIDDKYKAHEVRLKNLIAEKDALNAKINKKQTETPEQAAEPTEVKKVPKKRNTPQVKDEDESLLGRLDAEIAMSKTVTKEDIGLMFNNYKKIRAIANGSASEYYLLQNELANDRMLGSKHNRDKKYEYLGKGPLKDILFKMRYRAIEDDKIYAQKRIKSMEIDTKVEAVDGLDKASIEALLLLQKKGRGLLSKNTLEKVVDTYNDMGFAEADGLFDITSPNSIFEKDPVTGHATTDSKYAIFKEAIIHNKNNVAAILDPNFEINVKNGHAMDNFFDMLDKNISKASIPVMSPDGNEVDYMEGDFLDTVRGSSMAKTISNALDVIPEYKIQFRNSAKKATRALETTDFFDGDEVKGTRNITTLLREATPTGDLRREDLLIKIVGELTDAASSSIEGKMQKTNVADTDEILKQIEVKEAVAKVLRDYSRGGLGTYKMKMLANFRRNVLDIIDFDYQVGESPDSQIEQHAYKDYTYMSDFFVDFIVDPIKFEEATAKDEDLRSDEDIDVLNRHIYSNMALGGIAYTDPNDSSTLIPYQPDPDALHKYLSDEFNDLREIPDYIEFAQYIQEPFVMVPNAVAGLEGDGMVKISMQGITALSASKWALQKLRKEMSSVSKAETHTAYIGFKTKEIETTWDTYNDIFVPRDNSPISAEAGEYMIEMAEAVIPDFGDLVRDPSSLTVNQKGALNIKIEKFLFDVYSKAKGDVKSLPDPSDVTSFDKRGLRETLDEYLAHILEFSSQAHTDKEFSKPEIAEFITLLGAFNTDFTPFYARYKRMIMDAADGDDVLIASQEFAAKYAAAYVYSESFKNASDQIVLSRPPVGGGIPALFVIGKGGSGKSTAVTNIGFKIGSSILEDAGVENTSIMPVSNTKEQVDIISKSVGDLAGDFAGGLSVDELEALLIEAINNANTDGTNNAAAEKLLKAGAIVIDEATYVNSLIAEPGKPKTQMHSISELLNKFNIKYNSLGNSGTSNRSSISLVLLGDPNQSGIMTNDGGVTISGALDTRNTMTLPYLDYSFRSRNSFLVGSLQTVIDSISGMQSTDMDITLRSGTQYGLGFGRYYGLNVVAAEDENSNEFYDALDDLNMIQNIKDNIDKVIEENKALKPGEKPKTFSVILAPESLSEFDGKNTAMHQLSEDPVYGKYIKKRIKATEVGGSEANYVFAEMPSKPFGDINETAKVVEAMGNIFNTIATRAFDFGMIVVKTDKILIPYESESKLISKDRVILPSRSLDEGAKKVIRANYVEIFEDVEETAGTVDVDEEVEGLETVTLNIDPAVRHSNQVAAFTDREGGVFFPPKLSELYIMMDADQKAEFYRLLNNMSEIIAPAATVDHAKLNTDLHVALDSLQSSLSTDIHNQLEEVIAALNALVIEPDGKNKTAMIKLYNMMFAAADATVKVIDNGMIYHELANTANITVEEFLIAMQDEMVGEHANVYETLLSEISKDKIDEKQVLNLAQSLVANTIKLAEDTFANEDGTPKVLAEGEVAPILYDLLGNLGKDKNQITRAFRAALQLQSALEHTDLSKKLEAQVKDPDPLFGAYEAAVSIASMDSDNNASVAKLTTVLNGLVVGSSTITGFAAELDPIFAKYSNDSAVTELRRIVSDLIAEAHIAAEARRKAAAAADVDTEIKTDDLERAQQILGQLGVYRADKLTVQSKIGKAIADAEASLLARMRTETDNGQFNIERNRILELKEIYNRLFHNGAESTGRVKPDKNHTVKGFKHVGVSVDGYVEDTQEAYIARRDKASGGKHIVIKSKEFKYNNYVRMALGAIKPLPGEKPIRAKNKILTPAEALDLFNFTGNTASPIVHIGIRFIYNTKYNTKHAAHITFTDTDGNVSIGPEIIRDKDPINTAPASKILNLQVEQLLLKGLELANNDKNTFEIAGHKILDIPIRGKELKRLIYSRAGQAVKADPAQGERGLTLSELALSGVNVVPDIFANMQREAMHVSSREGNNVHGELYTFYAMDGSMDIGSKALTDKIKSGQALNSGQALWDDSGTIGTELGILPITLTADFVALSKITQANRGVTYGEFPSVMSLVMQKYFANYILAEDSRQAIMHKQTVNIDVKSDVKLVEFAENLLSAVDTYIGDVTGLQKAVDDAMATITQDVNSPTNKFMTELAFAFLHGVKGEISTKVPNPRTRIMHKPTRSPVYLFNVNDILTEASHPVPDGIENTLLSKLQVIAEITKYKVKPSILMTDTDKLNAGKLDPAFFQKYSALLQTPFVSISTPSLVLTAEAFSEIESSIEEVRQQMLAPEPQDVGDDTEEISSAEVNAITDLYDDGKLTPDFILLSAGVNPKFEEHLDAAIKFYSESTSQAHSSRKVDFVVKAKSMKEVLTRRKAMELAGLSAHLMLPDDLAVEYKNKFYSIINKMLFTFKVAPGSQITANELVLSVAAVNQMFIEDPEVGDPEMLLDGVDDINPAFVFEVLKELDGLHRSTVGWDENRKTIEEILNDNEQCY